MQDEKEFIQRLISICQILNNRSVQYLVVGGAAVSAHGFYRPTTDRESNVLDKPDFDFWFNPHYLNYRKLLNAFEDMGFDLVRFKEEEHPFPKSSFFRFKPEAYTFDFLPKIGGGLSFSDCYSKKAVSVIEGTEVSVIGIDDLLISKKATGRKKDLEDIRFLEEKRKQL